MIKHKKLDSIDEEEDDILIELAKILSNFLDFIGGKQHILKIFKLLELLLVLDEAAVRNEVKFIYKNFSALIFSIIHI